MITRVRPLAMRKRLALTIASLSASSALVASSRIRMRGSPISARAVGGAFLYVGLIAARQMLDELFCTSQPRGINDVFEARVRLCRSDGLADRATEQETVLQHHTQT